MPPNYMQFAEKLLELASSTNSYGELFDILSKHVRNANELLRFALTGCKVGVGLKELHELLGRERVIVRIRNSIKQLNEHAKTRV